jgi:hypothetical protein
MAARSSKSSKAPRTVRVRFLSSVKMSGRWYSPGQEVAVSVSLARDFVERGLVEKCAPGAFLSEGYSSERKDRPREKPKHSNEERKCVT